MAMSKEERNERARIRIADRRREDPTKSREAASRRYNNHKNDPEFLEGRRQRYQDNKEDILLNRKLKQYGITREYLEALIDACNGLCSICTLPFSGGRWDSFVIDHDHETGEVRGLLCSDCNINLHVLEDDDYLVRGLAYLSKHNNL